MATMAKDVFFEGMACQMVDGMFSLACRSADGMSSQYDVYSSITFNG